MWSVPAGGSAPWRLRPPEAPPPGATAATPAACVFQDLYYVSVKALYTVGYSTSLVSLTIAMVILCRFR